MEAEIFLMSIQNGLGRSQFFFQNQECVNILGCSVTFYEYKNVFLMLVDNVCTIQALFVTKPLHYKVTKLAWGNFPPSLLPSLRAKLCEKMT